MRLKRDEGFFRFQKILFSIQYGAFVMNSTKLMYKKDIHTLEHFLKNICV